MRSTASWAEPVCRFDHVAFKGRPIRFRMGRPSGSYRLPGDMHRVGLVGGAEEKLPHRFTFPLDKLAPPAYTGHIKIF